MQIARRQFLKMMGAFGASLAAEGLAPKGIIKPAELVLPKEPTVVGPMPRKGGGISNFVEIGLAGHTITIENPLITDYTVDGTLLYVDRPSYATVNITMLVDGVALSLVDNWVATNMHGKGGILRIPQYAAEWLCVFCGSPQPMIRTHCSQCGGARDWVVE